MPYDPGSRTIPRSRATSRSWTSLVVRPTLMALVAASLTRLARSAPESPDAPFAWRRRRSSRSRCQAALKCLQERRLPSSVMAMLAMPRSTPRKMSGWVTRRSTPSTGHRCGPSLSARFTGHSRGRNQAWGVCPTHLSRHPKWTPPAHPDLDCLDGRPGRGGIVDETMGADQRDAHRRRGPPR